MAQKDFLLTPAPTRPSLPTLSSIMRRVQTHAMTMIYLANNRSDVEKGDPKVGGHPSACSSALHLLSSLHMVVKNPQDYIAVKPHASPTDHANNYLLKLFLETDGSRMSPERAKLAMKNLRHYSATNEPVFQSYHSAYDPDHWRFIPSGSVGIPPVQSLYLAHAHRMAEKHGYVVPDDSHFWCLMGDSEFREGSLTEAMPEAAERGLGNLTWILDYNRQSLDGHRVVNEVGLGGKDNDRVEKMMAANGWEVIQLRHGPFRRKVFASGPNGEALQNVFESALSDYEYQSILSSHDSKKIVEAVGRYDQAAKKALSELSDAEILTLMSDLGGHDIESVIEALEESKSDKDRPTFIVAHTVKGFNLDCAAQSTNHSAMIEKAEILRLRKQTGLESEDLFAFEHFESTTPEGAYLKARGDWLLSGIHSCKDIKKTNLDTFKDELQTSGALESFPTEIGINLKLVPLIHTQWMIGQLSAKLVRIAETPLDDKDLKAGQKPLSAEDKKFRALAKAFITMAPDVGTSTNLNSTLDGRIFGHDTTDFETEYGVKDTKSPDIVPHESDHSRFIRFDIAESNTMSCVASYGKMADFTGVPFLPLMTVYDFFIKRALDQYFFGAYWKSSCIVVGTPSGVTLSPEGAQHGWKTDIQIANSITWEPAYCQELDWILTETIRRHCMTLAHGEEHPESNQNRQTVIIRAMTRSLEQREFLARLKKHPRFSGKSDAEIFETTRKDCLAGAYYLVDHRGSPGYRPSENVVNIFTMGSLVTEALAASDDLLATGIFANVIQVSSPDLLLGNLADLNDYHHLRHGLGISGDLFINSKSAGRAIPAAAPYPPTNIGPKPFDRLDANAGSIARLLSLGGRRIPVVSVHDGEPGILDNIGSVLGTMQKSLSVRKHSKCGRPSDIYHFHKIDREAVVQGVREILERSAISGLQIDSQLAQQMGLSPLNNT